MLKVLRLGSTGYLVTQWQVFLRGQGYLVNASGTFDQATSDETIRFQRRHRLDVDGVVGNQTLGKAALLGFEIVEYTGPESSYPERPDFPPLVNTAERQRVFGPLEFEAAPTDSNPERIRITNDWASNNLVQVAVPQLIGIRGANARGTTGIHRKAADQFIALWAEWERQDLLELVLTYEGSYAPRFIRGAASQQNLSNHAFATAFDINYKWNRLGVEPATVGTTGCVYPLVPVAHQFGFFWGGHFTRRDGMHFEVAAIL